MPTNIFKIINDNIIALAEDMNKMHQKVDALMTIFYQSNGDNAIMEMPKTDGDAPTQI
jgi:hypothetical protein